MAKVTAIASRRSAGTVALISQAASFGYATRASFGKAIAAASKLVPSNYLSVGYGADGKLTDIGKRYTSAIRDFGIQYKAGHLVAYLEPHYESKRWSNLDQSARVEAAIEILDKPEPESDKGNRRTAMEHKGCRAAISAWSHLKSEAGLKPASKPRAKTGTQQLKRAAGDEKEVPTSFITVPKFVNVLECVRFFDRISADLLNKAINSTGNSSVAPIGFKSAVQDFRKAVREVAADVRAGAKREKVAKADKSTVSAADIASRMQNPPVVPAEPTVQ